MNIGNTEELHQGENMGPLIWLVNGHVLYATRHGKGAGNNSVWDVPTKNTQV